MWSIDFRHAGEHLKCILYKNQSHDFTWSVHEECPICSAAPARRQDGLSIRRQIKSKLHTLCPIYCLLYLNAARATPESSAARMLDHCIFAIKESRPAIRVEQQPEYLGKVIYRCTYVMFSIPIWCLALGPIIIASPHIHMPHIEGTTTNELI